MNIRQMSDFRFWQKNFFEHYFFCFYFVEKFAPKFNEWELKYL